MSSSLVSLLFLSLILPIRISRSLSVSSPSPSVSPPESSSTDFLPSSASSPFSSLSQILSSLGYNDLSLASQTLSISLSSSPPIHSPITVFAPSDASLRTCSTCSLSLLLLEHSLPGLYPSSFLHRLPFGTKLESLLPGRCLTLTSTTTTTATPRLFITNSEITLPDVYTSSHLIIHGVHGFLSHLSPYSCSTPSPFPHAPPSVTHAPSLTRFMLADVMLRLRSTGYSILALAMRVKYADLVTLQNMTIFAVDDTAIFHGGHAYVHSVRFHILPNILLHYADLERLPAATVLPTLEYGESLTVTSGAVGGGGVGGYGSGMMTPMRINYVRVKIPDLLYNMKIVVHGLSSPFPRLAHATAAAAATTTTARQFGSVSLATVSQDESSASSAPSTSTAVFESENEDHFGGNYGDDEGHHGL